MFYENVTWDQTIKKQFWAIINYKRCIQVDLILKHNQMGTILGRVRYMLFIQLIWSVPVWRHMKRCHGRLHYDRKFQIFIFLIGYINVNKGVFCLIISYLRKSYNVLNYNNCSTDWSFPSMATLTAKDVRSIFTQWIFQSYQTIFFTPICFVWGSFCATSMCIYLHILLFNTNVM